MNATRLRASVAEEEELEVGPKFPRVLFRGQSEVDPHEREVADSDLGEMGPSKPGAPADGPDLTPIIYRSGSGWARLWFSGGHLKIPVTI